MNSLKIIVDSTCDLDPALTRDMDLEVLPLVITIDDKSYLDREEIQISEIYDAMRGGSLPTTSQIPYGRAYDLFKACFEQGDDFIYIAFSSVMSNCYSLGLMAAEELAEAYPGRKYAVIDARGGSSATGLIVLQALRLVRDGESFETVKSEIEFMAEHVEHVFSVDDLAWLAKGGRVSKLVGHVGSVLNIHPILDVENGLIVFKKLVRGQKKAIQTVAEEVIRRAGQFTNQLIAVCHADDEPAARLLERLIREKLPSCKTTLCHIGGVIGVHIGLKGIGAFCFNQKPPRYRFI